MRQPSKVGNGKRGWFFDEAGDAQPHRPPAIALSREQRVVAQGQAHTASGQPEGRCATAGLTCHLKSLQLR